MMTPDEKQFAIDLLKALDMATGGTLRDEDAYESDLKSTGKHQIKTAVRFLITVGYKKCSSNSVT